MMIALQQLKRPTQPLACQSKFIIVIPIPQEHHGGYAAINQTI